MLAVQYLFIFCLALGAACNSDRKGSENTADSLPQNNSKKNSPISAEDSPEERPFSAQKPDTLYRISGTEPFWSLVIAKPQIFFTSMEGDTLTFEYQEPKRAAGRPADFVQVYSLDEQQLLILRKETQCPCSDGMSDIEYPYQATLILTDRILEGCGRSAEGP